MSYLTIQVVGSSSGSRSRKDRRVLKTINGKGYSRLLEGANSEGFRGRF